MERRFILNFLRRILKVKELIIFTFMEKTAPFLLLLFILKKNKSEIDKIVNKVNSKLSKYERVKKYCILNKGFDVDDGTLTPTLKKVRKKIAEIYEPEIK